MSLLIIQLASSPNIPFTTGTLPLDVGATGSATIGLAAPLPMVTTTGTMSLVVGATGAATAVASTGELAACKFLGGAAGTAVTAVSEPFFTSNTGTVTYAAIGDGRMGMRATPTGFGQMFRSGMNGRTKYGLRWKTKFESSAATTAYYFGMNLRNGTTNRADVGLRNAAGARHAAFRNDFVYIGEAAGNTMLAGEIWSYELIVDGTTMTVSVWEGDVDFDAALPVSTYAWGPTTLAIAADNFWVGSGGATDVSAIQFDIRLTDGTQQVSGSLNFITNSVPTSSSAFVVNAKTSGALMARVEATPTAGGATVVGASVVPDAYGYVALPVTGLVANTKYNYSVIVDGASRGTGTSRTLPSVAAVSYRGGWGSCVDTASTAGYGLIAARDVSHFNNVGDDGYTYITGGANGNTSPVDEATVLANREAWLGLVGNRSVLWTGVPVFATYSDCDGAGANADGTTGGHSTGVVQSAFRRQYALPTLDLTGSAAFVVKMGRVWEVHTDETAAASIRDSVDNASKTKLGAAQKAWFFATIDAAKLAGASILWLADGPWIEPPAVGSATYNSWTNYNTERIEIGAYIAASRVKLVRLHGDTHTLFYDDGTNNPWGGFPTASAAPMHTTAQAFGYTVSGGKWPTVATNSSRQYGVYDVTDTGTALSLVLAGYSSTNAEPIEVQRFAATVDMTPMVVTSTTGTMPLDVGATGAAGILTGTTGTMPLSVGATGAAFILASTTGTMPLGVGATGAAATVAGTTGTMPLGVGATGAAATSVSTTGTMPLGVGATGAAATVTSTTGTMPLGVGATGAAATSKSTTGTMPLGVGATGAAATSKSTTGTMPLGVGATGAAATSVSTTGSLPLGIAATGTANASGGTTGTLPLAVGTTGAAATVTSTTGSLPLGVGATSAASTSKSTTGSLPLGVAATGTAATVTSTTGSLPLGVGATGTASAAAKTTGTLPLSVGATGAASAIASTTGSLPLSVGTTGAAATSKSTTGSLPLSIAATGAAATSKSTTGSLSIALGLSATSVVSHKTSGQLSASVGIAGGAAFVIPVTVTTGELPVFLSLAGVYQPFGLRGRTGLLEGPGAVGSLGERGLGGTLGERDRTGAFVPRSRTATLNPKSTGALNPRTRNAQLI